MKRKIVPFSLLTLFIGLSLLLLSFTSTDNDKKAREQKSESAQEYLAKMRNNQASGVLNPADVEKALKQIESMANRGSDNLGMAWADAGPDNIAGRMRDIIFDKGDDNGTTVYAGSPTGGLWKSINTGLIWGKVFPLEESLKVSCITQADDNAIYVGTGEGFCTELNSHYQWMGFSSGLVGSGMYKSTDGENFSVIPSTVPAASSDTAEWAYINEIAVGGGKIYAATNRGLKISSDGGNTWTVPTYMHDSLEMSITKTYDIVCDTFYFQGANLKLVNEDTLSKVIDTTANTLISRTILPLDGNCMDVQIASDGSVVTTVDNNAFIWHPGFEHYKSVSGKQGDAHMIVTQDVFEKTMISAIVGIDTTIEKEVFETVPGRVPHYLPSEQIGRMEFAFAPSDDNILYALVADASGFLEGAYRSETRGGSWMEIMIGQGSSFDIFNGNGCYANSITVFPNNPDRVLVGGENLWEGRKTSETGLYGWLNRSYSTTVTPLGVGDPLYVHEMLHGIAFRPTKPNEIYLATSGGVFAGQVGDDFYTFESKNKKLNTTQMYTVAPGKFRESAIGGAQENGMVYVSGNGNSVTNGVDLTLSASGTQQARNGGYGAISMINPEVVAFGYDADQWARSEDQGENFSGTFFPGTVQIPANYFMTPLKMWESFNNVNSRDTAYAVTKQDIPAGTEVIMESNVQYHRFRHITTQAYQKNDTIWGQDIISARGFIATYNAVWMSPQVMDFTVDPTWWKIAGSETDFGGRSQCIGISEDANMVMVGTQEGKLFRITNLALAYNYDRADVRSPECIVATKEIEIINPGSGEANEQCITSVSVDPQDPNHVIVTMGNYGNEHHIYRSTNALAENPTFTSIQGNLPSMPVYASLIEMKHDNIAIIGTDYGIWATENLGDAEPTWTQEATYMGNVPVFDVRQQTVKKATEYYDDVDPEGNPILTTVPGVTNYGVIYAASYGRGLHRNVDFWLPVGIEENENEIADNNSITVYPNPVTYQTRIKFEMESSAQVNMRVYEYTGKLVLAKDLGNVIEGEQDMALDLGSLPNGNYILQLITSEGVMKTSKFVVFK